MFTYLDIQKIIGAIDKKYEKLNGFAKNFFAVDDKGSLHYNGQSNRVYIAFDNFCRTDSLSNPKPSVKKAIIYCHKGILKNIVSCMNTVSPESAEIAVQKMTELVQGFPAAEEFIRENIYMQALDSNNKLSVLFYIALLAASDAFDSKKNILKTQYVELEHIKKAICDHFPGAKNPSDEEMSEQIREECSNIPELCELIMEYVSFHSDIRHIHAAIFSAEPFFDLFSIPAEIKKMICNKVFTSVDIIAEELLSNISISRLLELMIFFPKYQLDMEILKEFGEDYISAVITLKDHGVLKEVSRGRLYRPYYVWLVYFDELRGALNRNVLYYVKEFPVLAKILELGRFDLLRTALTRLDFTEAVKVKMYLEKILEESF